MSSTAPHPGVLIRKALDDLNQGPTALARAIGASRPGVSNILSGARGLSPNMALRIEAALGLDAGVLLRQQAQHDLQHARRRRRDS